MMKNELTISLIHYNTELSKGELPPLGLLYLASYLKKNGFFNIYVVDLMLEENQEKALINYLKQLNRNDNNLVGYYMNTHTRFEVQKSIKLTRKILPDSIICSGGPHPTLSRESTMINCSELNFVVAGEGEETFLDVVKALSVDFNVSSIKNILGLSLKLDKEIIHNDLRPRISNLDDIPFPDRDLININDYKFVFPIIDSNLQKKLVPTSIITSRGCPYSCIFCSVADQWGRLNTCNTPEKVVEEIKFLHIKYGINAFYFFDDTFTLNKSRVKEICNRIIDEKLNIYWFCEIRANTIDEQLLTLMYNAGLRSVAMAVESGSPRILKEVVKKGITLDQATKVVEICKKLKIYIKVFFTYSYPEETLNDVLLTLNFIKNLNPDRVIIGQIRIYPGTPVFRYALEKKLIPENFDWFNKDANYNSVSNNSCIPLFIDKLSFRDFLFINREIDRIKRELAKEKDKNNIALDLNRVKKIIIREKRNLVNDIKRVHNIKDIMIVLNNYSFKLKQNIYKIFNNKKFR